MKSTRIALIVIVWLGAFLCLLPDISGAVSVALVGDSYTQSTSSTSNYGAKTVLSVQNGSSEQLALLQFDLSTLPAGTTSSDVLKATLTLFVNKVKTPGPFAIQRLKGPWDEATITAASLPAIDAFAVGNRNYLVAADAAGSFITTDVTDAVNYWLDNPGQNFGLVLVPQGSPSLSFDSKETTKTGHSARFEIVLTTFSQGAPGPDGVGGGPGDGGPDGDVGPAGDTGAQGPIGDTGPDGLAGASPQGATGAQGDTGASGATGSTGARGATGATGAQGTTGPAGTQGATGAQGSAGNQGATGAQGAAGTQGATGVTGPGGSAGSQGATGAAGPNGAQGSAGSQGRTGATGAAGATGAQGATPTGSWVFASSTQTCGDERTCSFLVDCGAGMAVSGLCGTTGSSENMVVSYAGQQITNRPSSSPTYDESVWECMIGNQSPNDHEFYAAAYCVD